MSEKKKEKEREENDVCCKKIMQTLLYLIKQITTNYFTQANTQLNHTKKVKRNRNISDL